ncbi:hypothetical protein ABZ816_17460 [Actinosynnema sp. NPDC047251]|uniref:Uncharacterized protein n=1 Tax=Saccharothrix espanaensis (strain ATCC 51144 / DSM 44229 / JCM 9112 / NBRC 15066 / NRRL 15764) TaxID=1179773 RepID=K0JW96_SACES|nr:hypothetical protein [Saccharothrix espanaensis]CCH30316.1 hypothetical protein BN6_30090 [Saccharothrix espanaensis DSM 44229]
MSGHWIRGPIGPDADRRVTVPVRRTVLVMVPHPAAGIRLIADVVPLLRNDPRIQVVFSVTDTGQWWQGTQDLVRRQEAVVVPWQQAVNHEFDLVLAAGYNDIDQARGPVLLLPHGAGHLASRKFSRHTGPHGMPHAGLSRESLTRRGRVLPAAIGLTHDDELAGLRSSCPEAAHTAVVVGDLCLDRMVASLPARDRYRAALGVPAGRRLITVSSTWAPDSTFGRRFALCRSLLDELPDDRVALVLHPNAWSVHGRWQIRAWLHDCIEAGLLVIPPEEGWRAAAVASDHVLGDHGSTTQYAAAVGTPVTLASFPEGNVRRGSLADAVRGRFAELDPDRPVAPQLVARGDAAAIAGLVSSRPGQAASALRAVMYRLMDLPEPDVPAVTERVPVPVPLPLRPERV